MQQNYVKLHVKTHINLFNEGCYLKYLDGKIRSQFIVLNMSIRNNASSSTHVLSNYSAQIDIRRIATADLQIVNNQSIARLAQYFAFL